MLDKLPNELVIEIIRYLSSSDALIAFTHVTRRLDNIACQHISQCLTFDSNMSLARFRQYFQVEHRRICHLVIRLRIDDYMHLKELVFLSNDSNNNAILFPQLERFYLWGRYQSSHLMTLLSSSHLVTLRHLSINMRRCSNGFPNRDVLLKLVASGKIQINTLETIKLVHWTVDPPPRSKQVGISSSADFTNWLHQWSIDRPVMVFNSIVHLTLSIMERGIFWLLLCTCSMAALVVLDVTFEYNADPYYELENAIENHVDGSNLSKLNTLRLKNCSFIVIERLLKLFVMPRLDTVSFINVYGVCSNDTWSHLLSTQLPHLRHFQLKLLIDPVPFSSDIDRLVQSFRLDPILSQWPMSAFVDERFDYFNSFGYLCQEATQLILHTVPYPGENRSTNEFWNFNAVSNCREKLHAASHINPYVTWYVNQTIQCGDSLNRLSKLMADNVRSLCVVYSAADQQQTEQKYVEMCSSYGLCHGIVELKVQFDRTNLKLPATKFNFVEYLIVHLAPSIRKLQIDMADIDDDCWSLWRPLFARQRITHLDIRFKCELNDNFSPLEQISSNFPRVTHLSVTGTYMRRETFFRVAVELLCQWPHGGRLQRLRLGYLYPTKKSLPNRDFNYILESLQRTLAAHHSSPKGDIVSCCCYQNALLLWR